MLMNTYNPSTWCTLLNLSWFIHDRVYRLQICSCRLQMLTFGHLETSLILELAFDFQ